MGNGDCTVCKFHSSNADYPEKSDTHCYYWKEWDSPHICMTYYEPVPRQDTAEENLMDNQIGN